MTAMHRWNSEHFLDRRRVRAIGTAFLIAAAIVLPRALKEPSSISLETEDSILRESIEASPADRESLSLMADRAFDIDLESPSEPRWRLATLSLRQIAPGWLPGKVRVVRAALFHWPELSQTGRILLKEEAAVLLQHPEHFESLALPLYRLTGDVEFLLANAPPNALAYRRLTEMSLDAEKFDDYLRLRRLAPRHFQSSLSQMSRNNSSGQVLLQNLLAMPLSDEMVPVARSYLEALSDRSPEGAGIDVAALTRFLEWAKQKGVGPLAPLLVGAALDPAIPPALLARVALAADNANDTPRIEARAGTVRSPEWFAFQLDLADSAILRKDLRSARAAIGRLPDSELTTQRALSVRERVAHLSGQTAFAAALRKERLLRFGMRDSHSRWAGLCDREVVCGRAAMLEVSIEEPAVVRLDLAEAGLEAGGAWVEIRDNGNIIAESVIEAPTTLRATIPEGDHLLSVEVLNFVKGSGGRRTVSLKQSSLVPVANS